MIPFIDMHCDTLTQANFHLRHDLFHLPMEQVDVVKLQNGGALAQFFAICLPSLPTVQKLRGLYRGDWKHILTLTGILRNTCTKHKDQIALLRSCEDLEKNAGAGKISAVLAIEDGRQINGKMERLERYHSLGVRVMTLTWNHPNCFGYPGYPGGREPGREEMELGLTRFGKEAVCLMNDLGILIDVSHLSDGGVSDVAQLSAKPFVASHSNCRAVCSHPRNLSDELIRMIAQKGGVIGLNQNPGFVRRHGRSCRMEELAAHLRHMIDVGGIDCAALGSDFDGCGRLVKMCMKGPQAYPAFAGYLLKNGFTAGEVEKIYYRNVERVLREVLP